MAFLLLALAFFRGLVKSSLIVQYKFDSNFGQLFYDYSESGNHGQNGATPFKDSHDTIPTKTGAYFSVGSNCYIMLPPNSLQTTPISLTSDFTLVMWFNSFDNNDYHLSYRIKDSSNYISLTKIDLRNHLGAQIKRGTYDSGSQKSIAEVIPPGKL